MVKKEEKEQAYLGGWTRLQQSNKVEVLSVERISELGVVSLIVFLLRNYIFPSFFTVKTKLWDLLHQCSELLLF